ncbi:protein of unknown function (plasmid) [Rhodovastum atsumiense]|nr:protein of unknown function [Rhodovastum atsumiense]
MSCDKRRGTPAISTRTFLHGGCEPKCKDKTTKTLAGMEWRERRLDIDPSVQPDIVRSMTQSARSPFDGVTMCRISICAARRRSARLPK